MLKPCKEWAERLSAYLDNEGTIKERAAVGSHLTRCPACRAHAELLRCDAQDTTAILQARTAGDDFVSRVMAQVGIATIEPSAEVQITSDDSTIELPVKQHRSFFPRLAEWAVGLGLLLVIGVIIFPVFSKANEKANQAKCTSQQKQIALGIIMNAQDHGNVLPFARNWEQQVADQVDAKMFICPTDEKHLGNDYAFNVALSGKSLDDIVPAKVAMTFDAVDGQPTFERHSNGIIMSFADGHVAFIPHHNFGSVQQPYRNEVARKPSPTIQPPTRNYGLAEKLQIAYSASLRMQTENVQGVMERTEVLFAEHEGFVLRSNYNRGSNGSQNQATVSGRVPTQQLGKLLVELGTLGTVTTRQVNGEDLTAQDIEQNEKLGDLHGVQTNLGRIERETRGTTTSIAVEDKRAGAAGEASGIRVDQYKLKSRVALAEVTVDIQGFPKPQPVEKSSFGKLAGGSAKALMGFLSVVLSFLIIVLIWIPVWGPVVGIVWYLKRKKKKNG